MSTRERGAQPTEDLNALRTGGSAQRSAVVLAVLWLIYFIHGVDRSALLVLLGPISREFGLSDSQLGLLSGLAYGLPFALAGIPLGALADRTNRKRLLVLLVSVWSLFTILAGLTRQFWSLLAARAVVGAAESGAPPAMLSILSDTVRPAVRSAGIGFLLTGPYVGITSGSLIAGVVAQHWGWRAALLTVGGPGFVVALAAYFLLREPARGRFDRPEERSQLPTSPLGVLRVLAAKPERSSLAGALVCNAMITMAIHSWLVVELTREHGMAISVASSITGLALGIFGGLGTLTGGLIASSFNRDGNRFTLRLCAAATLAAVPAGLVGLLSPSILLAGASLASWSFLNTIYAGPALSALLGSMPEAMRATTAAGTIVLTNLIGAGLGPQLVGFASDGLRALGDKSGLEHALVLAVSLGLLPGILYLRAARLGRAADRY